MNTIRKILILGIWLAGLGLMLKPDICNGFFICQYSPFPLIWILMAIFVSLVFFDFKKVWKDSMHRLHSSNEKTNSNEK